MGEGDAPSGTDLLFEALDARDRDIAGRAAAVIDIGERIDLLLERTHPHDANRKLIKHLRHERAALFSLLTTDGRRRHKLAG